MIILRDISRRLFLFLLVFAYAGTAVAVSRNDLPERKTTNGTLDFGGIGWRKIDWSWNGGLYHGYSGMDGSRLVLQLERPSGVGAQLETPRNYLYGLYECDIRLPEPTTAPQGATVGFFIYSDIDGNRFQEIDIEILTAKPEYAYFTLHNYEFGSVDAWQHSYTFRVKLPGAPSQSFYRMGFLWEKDSLAFLLDGKIPEAADSVTGGGASKADQIHRTGRRPVFRKDIPNKPGPLILNLWCGSSWSGSAPSGTTPLRMELRRIVLPAADSSGSQTLIRSCDLDGNGKAGVEDAVRLLRLLGSGQTSAALDWNGDGRVGLFDALKLLREIWSQNCPECGAW